MTEAHQRKPYAILQDDMCELLIECGTIGLLDLALSTCRREKARINISEHERDLWELRSLDVYTALKALKATKE